MDDRQHIEGLYRRMYCAMIEKDTVTLDQLHADEFVLTHMTGLRQTKQDYIHAIANGTLNYYSADHERIEVTIDGDRATLLGRSRVLAAVFGGGIHKWPLQLNFTLVKRNGLWHFTGCRASTYHSN